MTINPAQFRLLLAGPRLARLLPFMNARGYPCEAATTGNQALQMLRASPRHLLLLELELDDLLCAELVQRARAESLAGAIVLIDDPAKSGYIISNMLRGIDAYVATPPDEQFLFRVIERQLLAQWALAQATQSTVSSEEKTRLEKQLAAERAKVTELVKEIASLRDENNKRGSEASELRAELRRAKQLGSSAPPSPPVGSGSSEAGEDVATLKTAMKGAPKPADIKLAGGRPAKAGTSSGSGASNRPPASMGPVSVDEGDVLSAPPDERTSPVGWDPPADLWSEDTPVNTDKLPARARDAANAADLAGKGKGKAAGGKGKANDFDDIPLTRPGLVSGGGDGVDDADADADADAGAADKVFDDESGSDLFLDLENGLDDTTGHDLPKKEDLDLD